MLLSVGSNMRDSGMYHSQFLIAWGNYSTLASHIFLPGFGFTMCIETGGYDLLRTFLNAHRHSRSLRCIILQHVVSAALLSSLSPSIRTTSIPRTALIIAHCMGQYITDTLT